MGKVVIENNFSFCDSPGAVLSKIICGIPIPSLLTVFTSSLIGNTPLSRGDDIFYINATKTHHALVNYTHAVSGIPGKLRKFRVHTNAYFCVSEQFAPIITCLRACSYELGQFVIRSHMSRAGPAEIA